MHRTNQVEQVGADLSGLQVSGFSSLEEAASFILDRAGCEGGFAVAINAEKVITYRHDHDIRNLLSTATIRYPDGAGAVLALRRKGVHTVRIAGADLWLAILRNAQHVNRKLRVALIGGKPEVLRRTRQKLMQNFPVLDFVITADGYDGIAVEQEVASQLERTKPDLVFVALGSPRQEQWIARMRRWAPRAFYLGLGGSFDVYVGEVRRAPLIMQRLNLEWLFRLATDPRRIKRQIKCVEYLWLLLTNKL